MTVVYLDTLFALNALMDYLLLLASARLAGEVLHRGRMALGSVLGGAYAAAVCLPGMEFLSHPLCKAGCAVLMVVVGLGATRRLLRQTVIFFLLSCAFGGGVLAIALLGGWGMSLGGGIIYSGMDLKTVLLSGAGCYVLMTLFMSRAGRHSTADSEIVPVGLQLDDRKISFTALVDTGNTLSDPVSGHGVLVAEWDSVAGLIPELMLEDLTDPARGFARLNAGRWKGRFRLLPYRSVGVECGMLLAIRPDAVRIGGRQCRHMLVALSPTAVSDGGGYRALVGDRF
ncbi:MAG: sigma-E processing peptidase SpoIIGA [Oscillospiraceae bacterium]|nr:sigma-E processing peptidase SpoIIGA [Oscillospiraceae bacterium]